MIETVACAVDAPVPIRVTAARCPGAELANTWVYFIHPCEGDFFFPLFEGEGLDEVDVVCFTRQAAQLGRNLAILLGTSWEELWEDFEAEVAYLLNLQQVAGPQFIARVMPWSEKACLRYRERMDSLPADPGEVLRWTTAGVDLYAGRN